MKELNVLTDVDGVLLNWFKGFSKWMQNSGFSLRAFDPNQYLLEDCFFGIDATNILDKCREFNESYAIRGLLPMPGAQVFIENITKRYNARIVAITAMGNNERSVQFRTQNLNEVFGDVFSEIRVIGLCEDKSLELSRYKNLQNAIWLEDNLLNALTGSKLGIRSFLFDRQYNRDDRTHPKLSRVKDFLELEEQIDEYLAKSN